MEINVFHGILIDLPVIATIPAIGDEKEKSICSGTVEIMTDTDDEKIVLRYVAKQNAALEMEKVWEHYKKGDAIDFIAEIKNFRVNVDDHSVVVPGLEILKIDWHKKMLEQQETLLSKEIRS